VKNLLVKIALQKNSAALLTQRLEKQDLIEYFSKLAGSVLGILGAVGFIMNLFERNYEKVERNKKKQLTFMEIIDTRAELYHGNFLELADVEVERNYAEPTPLIGSSEESIGVRVNYILPYDDLSISQSLSFEDNLVAPNTTSAENTPLYKF
jgi:hypothetical protein